MTPDENIRISKIAKHLHHIVLTEANKSDALRESALVLVYVALALLDDACLIDNASSETAVGMMRDGLRVLEPGRTLKRDEVVKRRAGRAVKAMSEAMLGRKP